MKMAETAVCLGSGVVNWNIGERQSGRYGTLVLESPEGHKGLDNMKTGLYNWYAIECLKGKTGELFAKVLQPYTGKYTTRNTEVGEVILLGSGELFHETSWLGEGTSIGIKPSWADEKGNEEPWMNTTELYVAKECTVELYFVPKESLL